MSHLHRKKLKQQKNVSWVANSVLREPFYSQWNSLSILSHAQQETQTPDELFKEHCFPLSLSNNSAMSGTDVISSFLDLMKFWIHANKGEQFGKRMPVREAPFITFFRGVYLSFSLEIVSATNNPSTFIRHKGRSNRDWHDDKKTAPPSSDKLTKQRILIQMMCRQIHSQCPQTFHTNTCTYSRGHTSIHMCRTGFKHM